MTFQFKPLDETTETLVHKWLAQDYVQKWIHGQGLANTLKGMRTFVSQGSESFHYWIAYENETPFAFLMTSYVKPIDDPYTPWVPKEGKAITLDVVIGNQDYIGKGIAHRLIREFLKSQFPDVKRVFIDPESTNTRAIHVYEKAGFRKVSEYIAPWHPVLHDLMILDM